MEHLIFSILLWQLPFMQRLKSFFPLIIAFSLFIAFAFSILAYRLKPVVIRSENTVIKPVEEKPPLQLKAFTQGLNTFAKRNGLNQRVCFLVDMRLPSGTNRFFVYDLTKDSVLHQGLVTHGSGGSAVADSIVFSNRPGSNCTSLGKYRIGNAYYGKFGLAFKLHGLEKTNSNAFERYVVLHGHSCVPVGEVSPRSICRSWGCPTVSPVFLGMLQKYIADAQSPILLWVFN